MKHVTVDGLRMAVWESGHGRPIVLLHGFPFDHSMWQGQMPLADSARLIVPDLRGFGGSRAREGVANIAQLADDVANVLALESIDGPVCVGGLSMGGYVAQHLTIRHPNLVKSLVLADTRFDADTNETRAARALLADRVRREGASAAAEAMLPRLLATSTLGTPERTSIEERVRRMILATPPATIVSTLAALAERPDMTESMSRVTLPVLLVVGEEDVITPPECMREMAELLPKGELFVMPGCGHLAPLESAPLFNRAVLAFLADHL